MLRRRLCRQFGRKPEEKGGGAGSLAPTFCWRRLLRPVEKPLSRRVAFRGEWRNEMETLTNNMIQQCERAGSRIRAFELLGPQVAVSSPSTNTKTHAHTKGESAMNSERMGISKTEEVRRSD
jgi:hypothetical protein